MKIEWKAIIIGIIATLVVSFFVSALFWGALFYIGFIIGGLIAAYFGKVKSTKEGAVTGAISGFVVGIISIPLLNAIFTSTTFRANTILEEPTFTGAPISLEEVVAMAILGLILGSIGGTIGSFFKKKK